MHTDLPGSSQHAAVGCSAAAFNGVAVDSRVVLDWDVRQAKRVGLSAIRIVVIEPGAREAHVQDERGCM